MRKSYREGKNLSSGPEKFASRLKAFGIIPSRGVCRAACHLPVIYRLIANHAQQTIRASETERSAQARQGKPRLIFSLYLRLIYGIFSKDNNQKTSKNMICYRFARLAKKPVCI
jgi:hypothetical protein